MPLPRSFDLDAITPELPVTRAKRPDRPVVVANPAVWLASKVPRGQPFNVEFIKRTTGERRRMLARFGIPASFRGRTRRNWNPQDYGLFNVMDLQKGKPRMIPTSNIVAVNTGGVQVQRTPRARPMLPLESTRYAKDAHRKWYQSGHGPDDTVRPDPVAPFGLKGKDGMAGRRNLSAFRRAGGLKGGNRLRPKDFDTRATMSESSDAVQKFAAMHGMTAPQHFGIGRTILSALPGVAGAAIGGVAGGPVGALMGMIGADTGRRMIGEARQIGRTGNPRTTVPSWWPGEGSEGKLLRDLTPSQRAEWDQWQSRQSFALAPDDPIMSLLAQRDDPDEDAPLVQRMRPARSADLRRHARGAGMMRESGIPVPSPRLFARMHRTNPRAASALLMNRMGAAAKDATRFQRQDFARRSDREQTPAQAPRGSRRPDYRSGDIRYALEQAHRRARGTPVESETQAALTDLATVRPSELARGRKSTAALRHTDLGAQVTAPNLQGMLERLSGRAGRAGRLRAVLESGIRGRAMPVQVGRQMHGVQANPYTIKSAGAVSRGDTLDALRGSAKRYDVAGRADLLGQDDWRANRRDASINRQWQKGRDRNAWLARLKNRDAQIANPARVNQAKRNAAANDERAGAMLDAEPADVPVQVEEGLPHAQQAPRWGRPKREPIPLSRQQAKMWLDMATPYQGRSKSIPLSAALERASAREGRTAEAKGGEHKRRFSSVEREGSAGRHVFAQDSLALGNVGRVFRNVHTEPTSSGDRVVQFSDVGNGAPRRVVKRDAGENKQQVVSGEYVHGLPRAALSRIQFTEGGLGSQHFNGMTLRSWFRPTANLIGGFARGVGGFGSASGSENRNAMPLAAVGHSAGRGLRTAGQYAGRWLSAAGRGIKRAIDGPEQTAIARPMRRRQMLEGIGGKTVTTPRKRRPGDAAMMRRNSQGMIGGPRQRMAEQDFALLPSPRRLLRHALVSPARALASAYDPRTTYRALRDAGHGRMTSGVGAGVATLADATVTPGPMVSAAMQAYARRRAARAQGR